MSSERWRQLSDWHNAWLAGDAGERERLRGTLRTQSPELVAEADALIARNDTMAGFLETPAFVIAAARLAGDEAGLAPGTMVGRYQIASLIARGGMGIVYRATDTRLDRQVALKTLLRIGAPDDLGVERFLREARITASLDHPNIVKVFDVGMHEDQPYMVVELLEGETLREKLDRGPLKEVETRRIGIEVARGLVGASAAGLVHRDLKPENIFLTRAGVTKVLDFGIAKLAPQAAKRRASASTLTGILLGTAGYLAPEQIQGSEADGRSDLFALGSIMFEMLTGQRAFACENTVDTLHAIIHDSAPELTQYRADISASLTAVVARLLEKAPANRFQTAADLVWALEQGTGAVDRVATRAEPRPGGRTVGVRVRWAAAAVAAPVLVYGAWWIGSQSRGVADRDLTRFSWTLPAETGLMSAPVVSPDGRRIVWAGARKDRVVQVFVRDLSGAEATALAGTEGARQPFWSPDSKSIAFFARGKLQKMVATGGPAVVLADAPDAKGGAWSPAGAIVFQPTYRDAPLMRVSDQGGAAEPVTVLDLKQGDGTHRWPSFLPDGKHFLYLAVSTRDDRRGVAIGSIDGGAAATAQVLFPSDVGAIYVSDGSASQGFILSAGAGGIDVRPFDASRRILSGDPRAIAVPAAGPTPHQAALLSAAPDVMAWGSGVIPWGFRFGRVDRDGSNLKLEPGNQLGGFPRVSPDGRLLARCKVDHVRSNPDIWVDDLDRGTTLRLTTAGDHDVMPVWSPDATQVVYRSGTQHQPVIAFAAADGSGVKETRTCPESPCEVTDWSPNGAFLVLTVKGSDVWRMPLGAGQSPSPLLAEKYTERDARISPDGNWLAYVSDETGRPEVSLRSLMGPARRFVVSSGGGDQPVWRRDGAELFFAGPGGQLFATSVRAGANGTPTLGTPSKLGVPPLGERHWGTIYDVSRDGRFVYFPHASADTPPREFGVITGWRQLIKSSERR